MINLLPPDLKEEIVYARRNTTLLHWALAGIIAIAGIGVLIIFGQLYINRSAKLYAAEVEAGQVQLKVQKVDEIQNRVEEISSQLKLVVQVLSKEVLFSKLLRQIGAAMPDKTVLNSLEISKIQGGIDLTASAADQRAATQIQLNLADPKNKIFEKADINTIDCKNGSNPTYPCTVNLRALFGQNSQYFFLTKQSGSQSP